MEYIGLTYGGKFPLTLVAALAEAKVYKGGCVGPHQEKRAKEEAHSKREAEEARRRRDEARQARVEE